MNQDIDERLEKRLGPLYCRLRLGIEADHEVQVFGQGINYFHIGESATLTRCYSSQPQTGGPLRTRTKKRSTHRVTATRCNFVARPKGI